MSALPPGLRPPLDLAMAKAVKAIPKPGALPGGALYEPKWDGFRAILVADLDGCTLWSRQRKDVTRYSVSLTPRRADP